MLTEARLFNGEGLRALGLKAARGNLFLIKARPFCGLNGVEWVPAGNTPCRSAASRVTLCGIIIIVFRPRKSNLAERKLSV